MFTKQERFFFHFIFQTICIYPPLVAGREPEEKLSIDPKGFEAFVVSGHTKDHCEVIMGFMGDTKTTLS